MKQSTINLINLLDGQGNHELASMVAELSLAVERWEELVLDITSSINVRNEDWLNRQYEIGLELR